MIKKVLKKSTILRWIYDRLLDGYLVLDALSRFIKSDKEKMTILKDSVKSKRCFIIGNGPSLQLGDLDKLKNEDTFAVNRVFRVFKKTMWRPTYYCSHDRKVLGEIVDELNDSLQDCKTVFLNSFFKGKSKFNKLKNVFFFYGIQKEFYPEKPCFSEKIEQGIYEGYTVVYSCIQLAVYMGYKEIYLLGIDHNYSQVMTADGKVVEQQVNGDYMEGVEGKNYYLPQLEKTELAYKKAREICEKKGIMIKNATRGGKLEVFQRVELDDLFGE